MRFSKLSAFLGLAAFATTGCSSDDVGVTPRVRTSAALQQFNSCGELASALRNSVREEARTHLLQSLDNQYYLRGGIEDTAVAAPAAESNDSGARTEGVDFSGTNNQEQGVDEADFVKTDGYHHYVLNDNRLEIFSIPQFGEIAHSSTSYVEGYAQQMLLGQDKVAVFSNVYSWNLPETHPIRAEIGEENSDSGLWYYPAPTLTKITVFDVADRDNPTLFRELYLEGWYQTAREVNDTVRFVNHSWMQVPGLRFYPNLPDAYYNSWDDPIRQRAMLQAAVIEALAENDRVLNGTPLEDFLPIILERQGASIVRHAFTNADCADFSMPEDGVGRGITSILSVDLMGNAFGFDADHIVSNWATTYASTDTLVIAEPAQSNWWYWGQDDFEEATNFHRFDISEPGQTVYTGSGRVPGLIRGQFAMSEKDDMLRVATTTGNWWWWDADPEEMENHVYIMKDRKDPLEVIGHIGGIGLGEQLWSVRFVEDEAFLITFRQIDPLWTIDLADPTSPHIRGELEIPGVSTYLHPTDGDHLLAVGFGGDENGLNWNTQVTLFDITDRENPAQQSVLSMAPPVNPDNGWSGAWSEASWEHKAFQYWAPAEMLAIPVSSYRWTNSGYYEYRSGLELLRVSMTDGLSRYATIDHSGFFNTNSDYWWSIRDVRRSFFMGDYIYAFSDRGITIHELDSMTLMDAVSLPGTQYETYWH